MVFEFGLGHLGKKSQLLYCLGSMETPYQLPKAAEIALLTPSQLLNTQRSIANRMWELRHQFADQGTHRSKFAAAEESLWVEKARSLRRIIQEELVKRGSASGELRRQKAEMQSAEVDRIVSLQPETARLVLRERKKKKEQYLGYYHTERQQQQLPIIKRQPVRKIVNVDATLQTISSRSMLPRAKHTLQTTHRTQQQTITHTQAKEQQKVQIIRFSNVLTQKSSETSRASEKTNSKSKSKKKKNSAITAMMLEVLERTRINNGPIMLGKPLKKTIENQVSQASREKSLQTQRLPEIPSNSHDPQSVRNRRQEMLRNMKARSEIKEAKKTNQSYNSRSQKKLVSLVREFQQNKNKITLQPETKFDQPIQEQIKIEDDVLQQNKTLPVSKGLENKQAEWSYENEFLQPPPILQQLCEQSGSYDIRQKRSPLSKRYIKNMGNRQRFSRVLRSNNQQSRA